MKHRRKAGPGVLFAIAALTALPARGATVEFQRAAQHGHEAEALFTFAGDARMQLSGRGVLRVQERGGAKPATLTLAVPKYQFVERASSGTLAGDIMLTFEVFDGEGTGGTVCRIGRNRLRVRWCQKINSFNLYAAFGGGNALFVGALGYLARLNPETGAILWQHDGLFQTSEDGNGFCRLAEQGNQVRFRVSTGNARAAQRSMTLDRDTGRILRSVSGTSTGACD